MFRVLIQTEDFDLQELYSALRQAGGSDIGGIAMFVGLVRDRNSKAGSGAAVNTLTLEHYPGMTEQSIEKIISQAQDRWPLLGVTVVHRVGAMQPEEQIVAVLAASAHRAAAFAAAEFVMDYLKTDAVFWKKETTQLGERWIESTKDDQSRAAQWYGKQQQIDR